MTAVTQGCLFNDHVEILEGDGQEFYTLAPSVLTFRSTAPLDEFQEVRVNGEVIDSSNYTLEEGSTIVKLSVDYLKTLSAGDYNIDVVSANNTPSGGFAVKSPELNEYGFYYNQIYYSDRMYTAFRIYDNNCADIYVNQDLGNIQKTTVTYEIRDGLIYADGGYVLDVTDDGQLHIGGYVDETFYCLLDRCCADDDYLYIYDEIENEFQALVLDTSKERYKPALPNINGIDVTLLFAYGYCTNITEIEVPYGMKVVQLGDLNLYDNLHTVILHNSMTYIDMDCFNNSNVVNIIFNGTKAQWNMVEKQGLGRYYNGPTHVQCSDGTVPLN